MNQSLQILQGKNKLAFLYQTVSFQFLLLIYQLKQCTTSAADLVLARSPIITHAC